MFFVCGRLFAVCCLLFEFVCCRLLLVGAFCLLLVGGVCLVLVISCFVFAR